ncbi:MAG TPA: hypothetical protein VH817_08145 [Thermoleophilaceae bacterium]|jgi:hypothetical protein
MKRIAATALTLLALGAAACGSSGSRGSSGARPVDNPWFPLKTGSVWRYTGIKDGKPSVDVVKVPGATKRIQGVVTTAVDDRLYLKGKLEERTTDWYAQDKQGNVWYYGEDTAELDSHGKVKSTEGSWEAGTGGAQAGLFMPADPRPGDSARQEYYKGHAEDHFRVLRRSAANVLTEEWTPLEPGVIDHKHYRRGVGTVLEETVKGGVERNVLRSFKAGS